MPKQESDKTSSRKGKNRAGTNPTAASPFSQLTSYHDTNPSAEEDQPYIPRPPNCFIIFKSAMIKKFDSLGLSEGLSLLPKDVQDASKKKVADFEQALNGEIDHLEHASASYSSIASCWWRTLSESEKQEWKDKERVASEEHRKLHPGYKYNPKRKADKNKATGRRTRTRRRQG
jgi:hypothetical protein